MQKLLINKLTKYVKDSKENLDLWSYLILISLLQPRLQRFTQYPCWLMSLWMCLCCMFRPFSFFFFVGRIVYVHVCQVTSVLIHREKHKSPGKALKLKCLDQSWARSGIRKHMSLCLNPFYVGQVEAGQMSSDPPLHKIRNTELPCLRSTWHFRSDF